MLRQRRNPVGVKAELNNYLRLDEKWQITAETIAAQKRQIQSEKLVRTYCWQKERKKRKKTEGFNSKKICYLSSGEQTQECDVDKENYRMKVQKWILADDVDVLIHQ